MRRRAILYGLVVVVFLLGWMAGMIIQAANISAADPAAVKVVWSKPCDGDRVIVTRSMVVKCVKDVPPPLPTPTPAPTQDLAEGP